MDLSRRQEPADSSCVLWAVDVEICWPNAHGAVGQPGWQTLLALLPLEEQAEVSRYVQPLDQRRALVSRLLVRALGCQLLGPCRLQDVPVRRTRGGKPFFATVPGGCAAGGEAVPASSEPPGPRGSAPNLNFNVSHEGAWVVLASDSHALVGVDVAAAPRLLSGSTSDPGQPTPSPADGLQARFRDVMAEEEWQSIRLSHPHEYRTFQMLWSLKEAFIKARGDGLAFSPLRRARFELLPPGQAAAASAIVPGPGAEVPGGTQRAQLVLDGQRQDLGRWRFDTLELPKGHVLSVARGPPAEAVDSHGEFRATFGLPGLEGPELACQLERPLPVLRVWTTLAALHSDLLSLGI